MKNKLKATMVALATLMCLPLMAQTDVTSKYLQNADFSTGWATSKIGNSTANNVDGWTVATTGDAWYFSGAVSYAGGVVVNDVSLGTNPDGGTTGGALGLSIGWGCTVRYTQAVTLAAGKYRISYKAYNANTSANQCYNFIGFEEGNGTTHFGKINNFLASTWMEESITVELTSATKGNICVGIGAVSGGSGANAKLFVDAIKIEAYNACETLMPGQTITAGGWTGNSGTYQNTYPEYYSGAHFTGDAMTNTTTVDNGNYEVDLAFQAHMAWISNVAADGALNAYINANGVTRAVGIVNNTGYTAYEPVTYHLDDVQVTDGSLVIKVGNSAQGANWLTVGTPVIKQMTTPTVSYGAFELPAGNVKAGYWYQTEITGSGTYTLAQSSSANITYTQDAQALTSASLSTTKGGNLELQKGTLYLKADAATTLSLTTSAAPSVVTDGTYFLKNEDGRYLTRGTDWGTRTSVDAWGLPVSITTDQNISTLKFLDNNLYVFSTDANVWSDKGSEESSTQFVIEKADDCYLIRSNTTQGYLKMGTGDDTRIYADGTQENAIRWSLENGTQHAAAMAALKAANASQDVTGKSSREVVKATSTTQTQEQYQGDYGTVWSGTYEVTAAGWYHFSIQAFARMASNDVTYGLHTAGNDSPSFYAFLGDQRIQLASVFDASNSDASGCVTLGGKNYPNNQASALTAFKAGNYPNDVWVYISTPGTYTYGIANDGRITNNQHWCCYAPQSVSLTRYYTADVEGYDADETFVQNLVRKVGDVNMDTNVDIADVTELVNMILGKTDKTDLGKINEDDEIDVSDVTELVNIILGKVEARTINLANQYALVEAIVRADQTSSAVTVNSATVRDIAIDASSVDLTSKLTTLNITCSAVSNVASVSVYANDKSAIAGLMKYNCETSEASVLAGDAPSAYASSLQSDVVTVNSAGSSVTVRLLPVALSSGVTVTVRTSDGKFYSQSFSDITVGAENALTFTQTTADNLWMSTIPGTTYFSFISTPGAHDAATSGCTQYTYLSKCQKDDLSTLLANGVRQFDLRPGYYYSETITESNLYIYHGQVSTNVLYKDAIKILCDFLEAHPSEAISVIMVKENSKPTLSSWTDRSSEMWSVINSVHSTYSKYMKVLDHSYYTLDDFRGKICYINRTGTECTNTTRITNWPDDTSVTNYSCAIGGTCYANVEDAYTYSSDDSKKSAITTMIDLCSANTEKKNFHYTYTSIAGSATSNLTKHANTMNPYTATYIESVNGPVGYILADYMGNTSYGGSTLLKAVINQNYKYVFQGR